MLRLLGAKANYGEFLRRAEIAGGNAFRAAKDSAFEQSHQFSAFSEPSAEPPPRGAANSDAAHDDRSHGGAQPDSSQHKRDSNAPRKPKHQCGVPYTSTLDSYLRRMNCQAPGVPPSEEQLRAVVARDRRVLPQGAWPASQPDLVDQFLTQMSTAETRTAELRQVMLSYQRNEGDTGSSEVQIALLTTHISQLAEHMKVHKKDFSTRRGLESALSRRRKLLMYLRRTKFPAYSTLIGRLGLRDNYQKLDQMTLQIQQRRIRGPSKKHAKKRGN